ncbi:MAG: hypothetical protein J7604_00620 [Sporocytophaga sp.]|uniref:hypothetical protein n=1 Tax=Sporocytophaga sp. TaxID=2231183 RepID=UPI001B28D0BD|nr:hypothetical protein [Sporocytophaga sp.]MBO9698673.1 hypothetical protein [Sporocytophaga sp.]
MKNRTIICLLSFAFLATIACKKNKEDEASPSTTYVYNRDVVGVYEGQTHEQTSDAGNNSDYVNVDSTYNDKIEVSLINQDSLKFVCRNHQYKFKLDTIDIYMKWLGKNTVLSFKFIENRELHYSFETKGWFKDSLHSQTISFKGYRK